MYTSQLYADYYLALFRSARSESSSDIWVFISLLDLVYTELLLILDFLESLISCEMRWGSTLRLSLAQSQTLWERTDLLLEYQCQTGSQGGLSWCLPQSRLHINHPASTTAPGEYKEDDKDIERAPCLASPMGNWVAKWKGIRK